MVLPPAQDVHPLHGKTFGDLPQGLLQARNTQALRLACSNHGLSTSTARLLQDGTSCENADELYCWHRCMNITETQESREICDETLRELKCVNPRGQLWAGEKHGDYYPDCADSEPSSRPNLHRSPTLHETRPLALIVVPLFPKNRMQIVLYFPMAMVRMLLSSSGLSRMMAKCKLLGSPTYQTV